MKRRALLLGTVFAGAMGLTAAEGQKRRPVVIIVMWDDGPSDMVSFYVW